jgi:hypothetical protein
MGRGVFHILGFSFLIIILILLLIRTEEGAEIKIKIRSKIKRGTQKSDMHPRGRAHDQTLYLFGRAALLRRPKVQGNEKKNARRGKMRWALPQAGFLLVEQS